MSETKTPEQIESLKDGWLADPCWDIYETEGFEAYKEELFIFQKKQESEWELKRKIRDDARALLVREQTGVVDASIVSELQTWKDIEFEIQHCINKTENTSDLIAAAHVRATLLQAAQLKRIADALENMDDGNSLSKSVAIWGSEQ